MSEARDAATFWRGLAIQWRVVGALTIREIYTRFGRESLGFAWIVAEPLVFAVPVLFMWQAIRGSHEPGISVMPFLWSGYLPILLFRHLGGRILLFIRGNAGLLYHRRVSILNIFPARAILEIGGNLTPSSPLFRSSTRSVPPTCRKTCRCFTWAISS